MILICARILLILQIARTATNFIGVFTCNKCTDRIGNFIATMVNLTGVYVCIYGVILK